MGFNSAFKGLRKRDGHVLLTAYVNLRFYMSFRQLLPQLCLFQQYRVVRLQGTALQICKVFVFLLPSTVCDSGSDNIHSG